MTDKMTDKINVNNYKLEYSEFYLNYYEIFLKIRQTLPFKVELNSKTARELAKYVNEGGQFILDFSSSSIMGIPFIINNNIENHTIISYANNM